MQVLRTTSGHQITIGYDPAANTLIFREEGWYAEVFRTGDEAMVTRQQRPIGSAAVTRLRDARRLRMRIVGAR
jgi:hypothetical protein